MHKLAIAILLATSTLSVAHAAPADVAAAVAASDRPADDVKLDVSRKPAEVMRFLELERGDRVLDWIGGQGYYAELIARAVGPEGKVTVLNPPGFMSRAMASLAPRQARLSNIDTMTAQLDDVALPANSYDLTLLHLVYHDFYWESAQYGLKRGDPDAALRKLFAATKPGGVVAVIDHVGRPGRETRAEVEATHRIDPAVIKADFARAGFVLEAESPLLRTPGDDLAKNVFDPAVIGRTDRVFYRFVKRG